MTIWSDVSYGLRQIARRPGLPLVVVLSLGFALGINSSLFTFVNAVWLAPWPVPAADRIRVVRPDMPVKRWRYLAEQTRAFSGLAARAEAPSRVDARVLRQEFVSANYFEVLGVPIFLGRSFERDEESSDAASTVAVISHSLWQTRFESAPDIIGRNWRLDPDPRDPDRTGLTLTIVGVAAPGFDGPDGLRKQLWLPLSSKTSNEKTQVAVFGRLAHAASAQQALADLTLLNGRFDPDATRNTVQSPIELRSTDLYSQSPPGSEGRAMVSFLLIGVAFISLVACANVSNLLLAQGHTRRGEIAIRLSLGATRAQIVRQLLVESALLTAAAAAIGLAVAAWLPEAALRQSLQDLTPIMAEAVRASFPLDRSVFLWMFSVGLLTAVAFGLVPALRCSDVNVGATLKRVPDTSGSAIAASLLSGQTIVSVMALAIAGLILRSEPVVEARSIRAAFADVSVVELTPPPSLNPRSLETIADSLSAQLAELADGGVAGLSTAIHTGASQTLSVTPNYFRLLRISALAGRAFTVSDSLDDVAIVNRAFALRFWPGGDALGQTIARGDSEVTDPRLAGRRVIGVVSDPQVTTPTAYLPARADGLRFFVVSAARDRVDRGVASIVKGLPRSVVIRVISGSQWASAATGGALLSAKMTSAFGGGALLFGSVGLFSLLEYSLKRRTREIGIRLALGAGRWDVLLSLLGPAAQGIARGLVLGSLGTAVAAAAMQRVDLPAGIRPFDLVTYAGVATLLLGSGLVAAYLPTRRSLRIAPSEALRVD